MLFNTPQYLLFLPIVVLIYYLLPRRVRYIWLLGISYYFYIQWNAFYSTLLFLCTLITYVGGMAIEQLNGRNEQQNRKKLCLVGCMLMNLLILGYFKYSSFGVSLLNKIFSYVHINPIAWNHDVLLPVGISFYTLQALGYLMDVYRGEIYAEKNFVRYALFVSFFPQLVAGPIERSKNLLVQLHESHSLDYENIRKGSMLILYGLFLKMVIADRAAIIVDTVYGNSTDYPGMYIVVATFFFSIQIYCDFYGYSTIARGSALLMGIKLMDNFSAPYFSRSVREFWRRWHISLSGWFRDYLYIPLGGSRKGMMQKEMNRLIVFGVSGLWHGASLAFVFWGCLNGMYQVLEDFADQLKKRLRENLRLEWQAIARFSKRVFQTVLTFVLVMFAWLFFRSGEFDVSLEIFGNMFRCHNWNILFDGSLYELGVAENYMNVLVVSIIALFVIDYHKYHGKDVVGIFLAQGWWMRVLVILMFVFTIVLYGCYGELYDTQQFIYFQF